MYELPATSSGCPDTTGQAPMQLVHDGIM